VPRDSTYYISNIILCILTIFFWRNVEYVLFCSDIMCHIHMYTNTYTICPCPLAKIWRVFVYIREWLSGNPSGICYSVTIFLWRRPEEDVFTMLKLSFIYISRGVASVKYTTLTMIHPTLLFYILRFVIYQYGSSTYIVILYVHIITFINWCGLWFEWQNNKHMYILYYILIFEEE